MPRGERLTAHRRRALARAAACAWTCLFFAACASTPPPAGPPRITQSDETPWVDVRAALGYNWSGIAAQLPDEVDRIDRVLRNRAVYRLPGFSFGHLMLGSGALYPYHSHASPEAYHVISGEAEWSVDGETRRVGPGTTIYHAPYADHRWVTVSEEPLRVVWAQWAPDGDRSGLIAEALRRRGGVTTGDFFPGERKSRSILPTRLAIEVGKAPANSVIDSMRRARLEARTLERRRPPVRTFVDSVAVPWNDEVPGLRWRLVFATPDLEWGHAVVQGPTERVVPAGETPALIHVLSGRATLRVGEARNLPLRPGTSVALEPGDSFEIDFGAAVSPDPLRLFWVRRASDPDLSYWGRDYFLVEPMPEPPSSAELARDVEFFPAE